MGPMGPWSPQEEIKKKNQELPEALSNFSESVNTPWAHGDPWGSMGDQKERRLKRQGDAIYIVDPRLLNS